jgi:hypothetical protein
MEYITRNVISYLMEYEKLDMVQAMEKFYHSVTYEKLIDEETGLYSQGAGYVYGLLKDELKNGAFIQNEI